MKKILFFTFMFASSLNASTYYINLEKISNDFIVENYEEEKNTNLGTTNFKSCLDILESGNHTGNGLYTITLNNSDVEVNCDMTTEGGGWTFILGAGTEYDREHSFWNGNNPEDSIITSYLGFSSSTENSSKLIKYLPFTTIKFSKETADENYVSGVKSSFSEKKSAQTPITGLIWNFNTRTDGYTIGRFLLASDFGIKSFDDYAAKGLGLSGEASPRGTYYGTRHYQYSGIYRCGNSTDPSGNGGGGCLYEQAYTSTASLGQSEHRGIRSNTILGLFFR